MNKTLVSSTLIAALLMIGLMVGTHSQAAAFSGNAQSGMASFYHDRFHGRRTASGAAYNKNAHSAAHKSLPLGTQVRVTDARSGRSVVVRINDRGPYARGRVIDLSRAAANEIGLVSKGVAKVRLEVLGRNGI
ncbi:MAG TPA: septal ring lytic transglycosylase RlpA family protein [Lamprocystis sp. (in: g-proteobacteria)]|nr:septal ring lytic transglycosylase RlpA family protein [Lamprocystis sp. (in: g-proteobacteria)]